MKPIIIIAACALMASAAACTEYIDLDLGSTSARFVVDGHITDVPGSHNCVILSLSSDYFANRKSQPVSGATVSVSCGGTATPLAESPAQPGCYVAPERFGAVPEHDYVLTVLADPFGTGTPQAYTATAHMPRTSVIDSATCILNGLMDIYQVGLYAPENRATKDFYAFGVSLRDSLLSDSYTELEITDDEQFGSDYCHGATVYMIDPDDIDSGIAAGDRLRLHGLSISKEFYEYLQAVGDITNGGNPMFSSAPANAEGNISGGALGFFAAFSVRSVDCVVRDR